MNGRAKLVRVSWMAVALLLLLAGIAGAVNPTMPQTNQPNQQDEQVATSPTLNQTAGLHPKLDKAKDLIGAKIINDRSEELGTVADIVLTPERDAVSYVVLSHGGVWGVAGKYFAVPWSQFGIRPGEKENERLLVLNKVSKADLDQAPGFDKNHWPTAASENWLAAGRDVDRSPEAAPSGSSEMRLITAQNEGTVEYPRSGEYAQPNSFAPQGYLPAEEPGRPAVTDMDQRRLSKLLGTKVEDAQGQDLGKLDNVMIDVRQGRIAFGIVSLRSGFLGLNKDYAPVPWTALDLTSQPGIAKLNVDKQTLTAVASDRDNFPNLQDPQYSRQLYERFHATPYSETFGYIPGEESPRGNVPSSEMMAPKTENPTPNTGNMPTPGMIANKEKHALTYNPDTVRTIHGTVQSVDTHRIEGTSMEEVRLHVKADDGKTVTVHVGPRSYLDRQNISFRQGDAVTITGSMIKTGHHEGLLASQIQTADKTLSLRDQAGKPLWNLEPSGSAPAPGSSGQMPDSYRF